MRAFTVTINADDNLGFGDQVLVEDGKDVRYHDVALVVERYLAALRARGSLKVPTRSQVLAEKARQDAVNAILKDWEPTSDGISIVAVIGGGTTFSRTWVKNGHAEHVVAPCDREGGATYETAEVLSKWAPPETMAEA